MASVSAVRKTSGARRWSRRAKLPPRAAVRKASTTSQSAGVFSCGVAKTLVRAREADLRAAADETLRISAMVRKSTPKVSCNINATRSAGDRLLITTCKATPTASASTTSSSGSGVDSASASSASSAGSGILERRRSKHKRVVTTVSHAGTFSMTLLVAWNRNHACWTMSSPSARSSSKPAAMRTSRVRSASNCSIELIKSPYAPSTTRCRRRRREELQCPYFRAAVVSFRAWTGMNTWSAISSAMASQWYFFNSFRSWG